MRRVLAGLTILVLLTFSLSAGAQDAGPPIADEADRVDDVVVVARRAGAPMWTVTRGESTVILVGAISGVPRDFAWRPEALQAATARSQRILYPTEAQTSMSDLLRLLWRIRTITRLPEGTTTADYLPADLQARVEVLMADENDRWRSQSLVGLGFDLLEKAGRERRGSGAGTVVRRAAREARLPGEPVGIVRGDELVEGLISDPPAQYVPCIAAAAAAAEAGPDGAVARLEAWRSLRVADVLANPLDQALNLCWPSGDPEIAPVLREQWRVATQTALAQPGVTMGVASLRILAEPGGVLDQLEAEGADILGPDWKPEA
ncbi:TraB/GumN family protein [Brevundimonas sp. R86498]|uniref:TraB/GumN family protein n=1 Tax=Brevundimonas sp. R86498 TaxID=3093845 RepID=UPI0037C9CEF3